MCCVCGGTSVNLNVTTKALALLLPGFHVDTNRHHIVHVRTRTARRGTLFTGETIVEQPCESIVNAVDSLVRSFPLTSIPDRFTCETMACYTPCSQK